MFGALVANIGFVFVGYCIAVLFPVPWLSRHVLDGWTWLHDKITHKTDGGPSGTAAP